MIPGVGLIFAGGILAATGGLVAGLMDMGVSEDEARYYQGEFESGRTLVMVRAGGRYSEAAAIMRNSGADDIKNCDSMERYAIR
ncbi:MAG: hypothetical protein NTZ05_11630 [Chloroflexi bacterium]|nr:hypothetical protein [Chloroflexota bacterium]